MVAPTDNRTARLAAALTARFELRETLTVLNQAGILPMPLKGVLLQQLVYADPADRMLSDADLLVPTPRFHEALAALEGAGFARRTAIGRAGVSLRTPSGRLDIDLHGRLFPRGLFGLRAEHLFARGKIDETSFEGVVVLAQPLDLYAHLIGNFAKGRHVRGDARLIRDLSAVTSKYALSLASIAAHLEQNGLARAARYALGTGAISGDAHCVQLLGQLAPDPLGSVAARAARALSARYGSEGRGSLLAPHLVNRSIPRGAVSSVAHVAFGLRARVVDRIRPAAGRR